jgi:hypothetical protein
MSKYRKKPVEIDAIQFDGYNHHFVSGFMGCSCGFGKPVRNDCPYNHSKAGPKSIFIRTLEGEHRADRGDWIVRGVKGEYYPCKPEIFEATYEAV